METKQKQLQLVTLEQAERLRQAGFDWETDFYYWEAGRLYRTIALFSHNQSDIAVPAVALALKWFRDVKGVYYTIDYFSGEAEIIEEGAPSLTSGVPDDGDMLEDILLDALLDFIETQTINH